MLPQQVLYYGVDEPLPEQRALRAGPLSLVYEAGDLRYIRLGAREVVRRIYVAVRDRNWGTVPATLTNVRVDEHTDSFQISYDATYRQGEIDFVWHGTIAGAPDGTIAFTMQGQARSTFLRNRIGFCVLHPIGECAGQPCTVEHTDGTVERGIFPLYVAPHNPFLEMRAIAHEVVPGVRAELRFTGDSFEMEDQRNWTDASYKTFCTPLRLPFPVRVDVGTAVEQAVTLTLHGVDGLPVAAEAARALAVTVGEPAGVTLPRIGLGVASYGQPLREQEIARLRSLRLAHLRVDLALSGPDYVTALRRATDEARALGVSLEVALHLSDAADEELRALLLALSAVQPPVSSWLVFHVAEPSTTASWVRLARTYLTSYAPTARFGAGTNAYFTQLNRGRPPVGVLDLACYSLNPQVHAFDNASLVETLEAQAVTVESARQFTGDLPLAITPVTLRPRFNPDATGPEPTPPPGEPPFQVDARQMSLFGAGWTLGSLKYLAESGVASVTYYETTGPRGVIETAAGSPWPRRFHSLPGGVFPLYHVLADVGEFAGAEVVPVSTSATLLLEGLALCQAGRLRLLLANLSAERQRVTVSPLSGPALLRVLDETNVLDAMRTPEAFRARPGQWVEAGSRLLTLDLLPYALARLDLDWREAWYNAGHGTG